MKSRTFMKRRAFLRAGLAGAAAGGAVLAAPAPIAGCALDDYAVRSVREVLVAMPVRAVETDAPAAPAWKPGTASSALG